MDKKYIVERPAGCQCWYAWDGEMEKVLAIETEPETALSKAIERSKPEVVTLPTEGE